MKKTDKTTGYVTGNTEMGTALVAYRCGEVVAILLGDDEAQVTGELETRLDDVAQTGRCDDMQDVLPALREFLRRPSSGLPSLAVYVTGTEFQNKVWGALSFKTHTRRQDIHLQRHRKRHRPTESGASCRVGMCKKIP